MLIHFTFCISFFAQSDPTKKTDFTGSGLFSETGLLTNTNIKESEVPDAQVLDIPSFTKVTTGEIVTDAVLTQGCAWVDYDNDNDMDLFVANNNNTNNALYSNNGDGTFTKLTSGIIVTDGSSTSQGSWGDYNNDGNIDLFITNKENVISQDNSLYLNNGNGDFTKITSGAIVNDQGYSFGSAWADINNDGYLDMFVVNQIPTENNFLYMNNGDETFTKITTGDIVNIPATSYSCSFGDYDNDNNTDLFVANRDGVNFLYHNNGDGTFTRIIDGDIANDLEYSIGANWVDYDNDLDLDLYVSNGNGENNSLYVNNNDGTFTKDTTLEIANDGIHTLCSNWADIDNDGDLDLYITTLNNNLLYANNGDKTFTRVTTNTIIADNLSSRGCAWADYDNDGDMDLFVANYGVANNLYTNDGNSNSWINIKCDGTGSNKSGIGAKVRLKATINGSPTWQFRQISLQSGYLAQNSLVVHFGLGDAQSIDSVIVEWTSGLTEAFAVPGINQSFTAQEGEGSKLTSAGSSDRDEVLLSSYKLSQNYPNPFNPSTIINYQLPITNFVSLKVYDVLGNRVATLVNDEKPAGNYSVNFNASNLSSGIYFYQLKANNFIQTKKMILIK
jgi:hypothetical protein